MGARKFSRLGALRVADPRGNSSRAFSLYFQRHCEELEAQLAEQEQINTSLLAVQEQQALALSSIQAALDAADAANAAAVVAQTAATDAQTAATSANDTIAEIQGGTLDLAAITIDGTKFINDGSGGLVAAP